MINYDYRSYFYSTRHKKDILIVNYSATVNIVPGEPPSAPGALFQIKTKDLVLETFDLEESLCSEDNLKFGLSESARLSFSIVDSASIPNLKSDGETRRIKVYIYFDGDSSTLLQVGEYICDKDELTSDRKRRDIECYDALYYLRDLDIAPWYYDVYANNNDAEGISIQNLRWSLFSWILNNSEYPVLASQATLINDDYKIPKTIESDTITFDFFMQGILEINGVFGHIGRTGLFEFKSIEWYSTPSVATLYNQHHKPFVKYEDFITWSIGYVVVYDKNNIRIGKEGSSAQAHPSNYKIYDSFVFGKIVDESKFRLALQKLRSKITNLRYRPFDTKCIGELSLEVGDKIEIQYNDSTRRPKTFYTYVLERHITGFGIMTDSISAKGDKKQPKRKLDNSNWHSGDSENSTSGEGTGGISTITNLNANEMIEYWRNIGIRLLDEPSDVSVLYQKESGSHWVELYWTDPSDITTKRPEKCEWLGTVVVRKENEAPKHRWDGELIVNSTTRNQYSETPFIDDTIDVNKKYFYGFFPYHRHLTDADNDVNFYRFTKVVSVNTEMYLTAPEITNLSVDVTTVTMTYNVPALSYGSYTDCRLVYKKNGIPNTLDDGTVVTLNPSQTSKTITGLDDDSTYFFMIFVEDSDGNTASSDPKDITTSHFEEDEYSYTGTIQTFVAPKTGIYKLETWGAQGGDATDGTNTARGGYGAYAYGETFLAQGEKLYIGVGGQNGYNGGGNRNKPISMEQILSKVNPSHILDKRSKNDFISAYWDEIKDYIESDYIIAGIQQNASIYEIHNNKTEFYYQGGQSTTENIAGYTYIPIPDMYVGSISLDYVQTSGITSQYPASVRLARIEKQDTYNEIDSAWYDLTAFGSSTHFSQDINSDVAYNYLILYNTTNPITITNIVINGLLVG